MRVLQLLLSCLVLIVVSNRAIAQNNIYILANAGSDLTLPDRWNTGENMVYRLETFSNIDVEVAFSSGGIVRPPGHGGVPVSSYFGDLKIDVSAVPDILSGQRRQFRIYRITWNDKRVRQVISVTVYDWGFTTAVESIDESCPDGRDINLYQNAYLPVFGLSNVQFSGNGVTQFGLWSPEEAGEGRHQISATAAFDNANLTTSHDFTVIDDNVNAGSDFSQCVNDASVTLRGSPSGGTWSGRGVSGTSFSPSDAGPGTHTLRYTVASGDCSFFDELAVTVIGGGSVNAGPDLDFCVDDEEYVLDDASSPGGTWSGPGTLNSGIFRPRSAGSGSHIITYTIGNQGCTITDTRLFRVFDPTSVSITSSNRVCVSSTSLSLRASEAGGTWEGPGITGSVFNASVAGVGSHIIRYEYTNANGCVSQATQNLSVTALPDVDSGIDLTVCLANGDFNLNGASPSGGTWSGPGVQSGVFRPNLSGIGSHTITYTVTNSNGCTNQDTRVIDVVGTPNVMAGPDFSVCLEAGPVSLETGTSGTPVGGVWSGRGIAGALFDPAAAGLGSHVLTYVYSNGANCTGTDTRTVTVRSAVQESPDNVPSAVCVNGGNVTLRSRPSNEPGWTGPGVTGGRTFNPVAAGIGTHTLNYSRADGNGCITSFTHNINVNSLPVVDSGIDLTVCRANGDFTLSGASPSGGVWSGTGVQSGVFRPSISGIGVFTITYTYTDGSGCTGFDTRLIEVVDTPTVEAGSDLTVCEEQGLISLSGATSGLPVGGIWSGTGITGTLFDPAAAREGPHILTYTYENGAGCSGSDTRTVTVTKAIEESPLSNLPNTVCINESQFTLRSTPSNFAGWSGPGVATGRTFDPSIAGLGSHILNYSRSDGNGCTTSFTYTITVRDLPLVDAGINLEVCIDESDFTLNGNLPNGGTWQGPGVQSGVFRPSVAGVGSHTVSYTFSDATGCSNTDIRVIEVVASPVVEAGTGFTICVNAGLTSLDGTNAGTPTGGFWTGRGVTGSLFDPAAASIGVHIITYTYSNGAGCQRSDTRTVIVTEAVEETPDVNLPNSLCINDASLTLSSSPANSADWSGPGVTDGRNFDPSSAGVGTHTLNFSRTDGNGCITSFDYTIEVVDLPIVDASIDISVCEDGDDIVLNDGFPGGGTWSGTGVQSGIFRPALSGTGSFTLTYSVLSGAGCLNTDTRVINVVQKPVLTLSGNIDVCPESTAINLNQEFNPSVGGGSWSGSSVNGNFFNPVISGSGSFILTYEVTTNSNCDLSATRTVNVRNQVGFNIVGNDSFCSDASSANLSINPSAQVQSVTYSGTGITPMGRFTPSLAGIGVHEITARIVTIDGCVENATRLLTVSSLPIVDAGIDLDHCIDDADFELSGGVPLGGTWSGSGVQSGIFRPAIAGVGSHTITYNYTSNEGCSGSDTRTINITALPAVNGGNDRSVCISNAPILLSDGVNVSPSGGTWSGRGITNNVFDPGIAGVGVFTATYTFTNSQGCASSDQITITVQPDPTISINIPGSVCINEGSVSLSFTSNTTTSNEVWSGPGVNGTSFQPSLAGVGNHTLNLTLSSGLCDYTATHVITVNDIPFIDSGLDFEYCINSPAVVLDGETPSGGIYTGTGVQNGEFNPAVAGLGQHIITYQVNTQSGCSVSDTRVLSVVPVINVQGGPDETLCEGADPFALQGFSPPGGVWSGTGITGNVFNPTDAVIGPNVLTYTVDLGNGCSGQAVKVINIIASPVANGGPDVSYCVTDPLVDISFTAGSWSGPGVDEINQTFDPGSLTPGIYVIQNSVTNANGCIGVDEVRVTINDVPNVSAGSDLTVCLEQGSIRLEGASPRNGTWSGTGVVNDEFFFNTPGSYVLTYTYTNNNGCTNSDTRSISVVASQPVSLPSIQTTFCSDDAVYNLGINAAVPGSWSGTGVVNAAFFNPALAGSGTHILRYTPSSVSELECFEANTITVRVNPEVIINLSTTAYEICEFDALTLPAITNGRWVSPFLTGVTNGTGGLGASAVFEATGGSGQFDVVMRVENNGCFAEETIQVTVKPFPQLTVPALFICQDVGLVNLNEDVSPSGGTWRNGTATVVGGNFIDSQLSSGLYTVFYDYTQNGCTVSFERNIFVQSNIAIDIGGELSVCFDAQPVNLLDEASVIGGTFSGRGVSGTNFNSQTAGVGSHIITYSFTNDEGCTGSATRTIIVNALPDLQVGGDISLCLNQAPVDLTINVSPAGGVWTGTGVFNNLFDPSSAGVGNYTLEYSFTNVNGCTTVEQKQVEVKALPVVDSGPNTTTCISGGLIDLSQEVSVQGGSWTGPGVSFENFNPEVAGTGTHILTYTVNQSNGCSFSDTRTIIVEAEPVITLDPVVDICANAAFTDLNNSIEPKGGEWQGPGVTRSGIFDATGLSVGNYTLTYLFDAGIGCAVSATQVVNVISVSNLSIGPDLEVCNTASRVNLLINNDLATGTFTGTGVDGFFFDPELSGIGDHIITFNLTTASGCDIELSKTISVTPPPTLNLGNNLITCVNAGEVDLDAKINSSIRGGSWTGLGVSGSVFDPAVVGVGTYTLAYSLDDGNGCISSATKIINVRPALIVNAGNNIELCFNDNPVDLTTNVSIAGGTFSGPGVRNGIFTPSEAGAGSHTITYSIQDDFSCPATDNLTIVVYDQGIVQAGADQSLCVSAEAIDISTGVFPSGGSWTGVGVSGNTFNPALAGVGEHELIYTVVNQAGCSNQDIRTITVTPIPVLNFGSDLIRCVDSQLIDLDEDVSVVGINWNGNGVIGSFFDAAAAGVGNHIIEYTVESNGCIISGTRGISVRPALTVDAGPNIEVCEDSAPVNLTLDASLSGGEFEGRSITNELFYPSIAGVGIHTVRYTITDQFGCIATDTRTIEVLPLPAVSLGSDRTICATGAILDLGLTSYPSGGRFFGPGVSSTGEFDPNAVGPGIYTIRYEVQDNKGCVGFDELEIEVTAPPTLQLGDNLITCLNTEVIDLDIEVSQTGGFWSGAGVSGSFFSASTAGIGNHTLTYVLNTNGCIARGTKVISVRPELVVSAGPSIELCENDGPVNLDVDVSITGGSFSGVGVVGNIFDPARSGAGTFIISYEYSNEFGCTTSATRMAEVNAGFDVEAGPATEVCITADPINLDVFASPTGGSWSGFGVNAGSFNPAAVGLGTHVLTYEVTTPEGCSTQDTRAITVIEPADVNIGGNEIICRNADPIVLDLFTDEPGGVWSGTSVNEGFFDPSVSGTGTHIITYSLNRGSGCISTATKVLSVREAISLEAGPQLEICENDGPVDLLLDVNQTGGSFSGTGVIGDRFDPALSGEGSFIITYTFSDALRCQVSDTRNIIVHPLQTVEAGPELVLCSTSQSVDIGDFASPSGGTWSGFGLTGSVLDPSRLGLGEHELIYTVVNAQGCEVSDSRIVRIDPPEFVNIGSNEIVCLNSIEFNLDESASITGGIWSGNGVDGSSGIFDPFEAGVGSHTISYVLDQCNGCISFSSKVITVRDELTVEAGPDIEICEGSETIDLTIGTDRPGGEFTGNGVSGNTFDPSRSGVGSFMITYSFADQFGCTAIDTRIITVVGLPEVEAGPTVELCETASPIDISNFAAPKGGVWSGFGISGNTFDPAAVGVGDHLITYTVTNNNGCEAFDTRTVRVTAPETVDIGGNEILCLNSEDIALDLFASTTGGTWQGNGITNGIFSPAIAGIGSHTITYTIDQNGCVSESSKVITVREALVVDAGSDIQFCLNDSGYDLTSDVNIQGGAFSGTGVTGNTFDPARSGVGSFTISYTYSDEFSCTVSDTRTITVAGLPEVEAGPTVELCETASPIDISTFAAPAGGVWSGFGISGNTFGPAVVGVGDHLITYTVTNSNGCESSDTRLVRVTAPEVIDIGGNEILCLNSEDIALDIFASITGGTWQGNGITNGIFSPATAGIGSHTITYTIDQNGCVSESSKVITVREALIINAGPDLDICINQKPVDLLSHVDRIGGTFSGTGVTGNTFDPTRSGVGSFVITYTYSDEFSCTVSDTRTITVAGLPDVEAGPTVELCETANPIDISTFATPTGGVWSGFGISGNTFDPAAVGVGDHTITYTVTNSNGCESSDTRLIRVTAPETVDIGGNEIICLNSEDIALDIFASITGGTWQGSGITNGIFSPATAGIGSHTVTYTIDQNGCVSESSKVITVREALTINAGPDLDICINQNPVDLLPDVDRIGGTFSGTGITGNTFDPARSGVGSFTITYTYSDEFSCTVSDTRTINVVDLPDVEAGPTVELCETASPIDISTFAAPAGGVWSGFGISANTFNPAAVGVGDHLITYTVTNNNGCEAFDTRTVRVTAPETVDIGGNEILCLNSEDIALDLFASTTGGTWQGNGITNGIFSPAIAGIGSHTITYTIDQNGCVSESSKVITVREALVVDAGSDIQFCLNDSGYDLTSDVNIQGGAFSGTGVTGNTFDPARSGVGSFTISYTYSDEFSCTVSDTRTITVAGLPEVEAGPTVELCETASPIDISTFAAPAGGVWSGFGISGNTFGPAVVGVGDHLITYTVTNSNGCESSDTRLVRVTAPEVIDIGGNEILCLNSEDIALDIFASITGGTWQGNGITNGIFSPATAGIGSHTITYTIDQNGCVSESSKVITVREALVVDAGSDIQFCLNDSGYDLTADVNIQGGAFSGTGVTGNTFEPARSGEGAFTITYTYSDEFSCTVSDTRTITVVGLSEVEAGPTVELCETASPIDISTFAAPAGGVWSGFGISGNTFDPAAVGVGDHLITYTVTNGNGCEAFDTRTVRVTAPETVDIGGNEILCLNNEDIALDIFASITGGTWQGNGITNGIFSPAIAGIGSHTITYTIDQNGCISESTKIITVREALTINAGPDLDICINQNSMDLLPDVDRTGGSFSGTGVTGNTFDPARSGVGSFTITYTYSDEFSCAVSDTRTITVVGLPEVEAGPTVELCETASPIDISTFAAPTGGVWSGFGISGNTFDPATVGVGDHTITYTVTNSNGCEFSDTRLVRVTAPEVIDIGGNEILCLNSEAIALDIFASITGGTWQGSGITNGIFSPATAGIGSHTITYTIDQNGCVSESSKVITVREALVVDAGSDIQFCLNDSGYDLTADVNIQGGVFSGTGVTGNTFDPARSGVGSFTVNYTYSDEFSCIVSDSRNITVAGLPEVEAGPTIELCETASPIYISTFAAPAGGVWSGFGISGNTFDPAAVGVGDHLITYTVTNGNGCEAFDTRTVRVTAPETVDIGGNEILCLNSDDIALDIFASITGGTWQGNGITNGIFSPATAGIGSHAATYTIDQNGCVSESSKIITVREALVVDAGSDIQFCLNDSGYNLTADVNIQGGAFSGTGVTGNTFDPARSGVGSFTITYTYSDEFSCTVSDSRTITVEGLPEVEAGPTVELCETASPIDISTFAAPAGGVWSGFGISGKTFDPAAVGVGDHLITYTVTNSNGCESSDTRMIRVTTPQVVDIGGNEILCLNSEDIALDIFASITGGTWQGSGITNGIFSPAIAGIGSHTITYTIDQNGCVSESSKIITVREALTINAGPDLDICINQNPVDLLLAVDRTGGSFSGTGITGNTFDPARSGVGSFTITYTYSDEFSCSVSDTRTITVAGIPEVEAGPAVELCETASPIDISTFAAPAGGVWSGFGISGKTFDPAAVGVGDHLITYTVTNSNGCESSDTRLVRVTAPEVVDIGGNEILCLNSEVIALDLFASITGGTWQGNGITNGIFSPAVAGIGTHTITYTISQNGCVSESSKVITVREALTINAGPDLDICINQNPVDLLSDVDRIGGSFSGTGVTGNTFDPSRSGVGSFTVTYTYSNEFSCIVSDSRNITVAGLPEVEAGPAVELCETASPIDISTFAAPAGGVWSGFGISGSTFNPSAVGVGDHLITYTVTNSNGCELSDTRLVRVTAPEVTDIGGNEILCLSSEDIALDIFASITGGTWQGNGITNGIFSPAIAGVGSHTITYTIDQNDCVSESSKVITVRKALVVDAGSDIQFCLNDSGYDLTADVNIQGGAFSGTGITGNTFDPARSGVGTFTITYTYSDEFSCTVSDTRSITVAGLPEVEAGPTVELCETASPIDISTFAAPAGGVWSGFGISGNTFDPAAVGIGEHFITYTVTNGNGCESSDTRLVRVTAPQVVDIGGNEIVCLNSEDIALDIFASITGGTWQGPGISSGIFNPEKAGLGVHRITYSFDHGNGCIAESSKIITVRPLLTVNAGNDLSVCIDDGDVDLQRDVDKVGGIFTGNGVQGNSFSPERAGPGSHIVTYVYENTFGCTVADSRIITVHDYSDFTLITEREVCSTVEAIDLSLLVSVQGGTWQGPGVMNSQFMPSSLGEGSYELTYSLTNEHGCSLSKTLTVDVVDPIPVNIGTDIRVCLNSGLRDLSEETSVLGGIWSIVNPDGSNRGIVGSFLNPEAAGQGVHRLKYTLDRGDGCIAESSKLLIISADLEVNAGPDLEICLNSDLITLSGASPSGGEWVGPGVDGLNFNAKQAGVGNHTILYEINLDNCLYRSERIVEVIRPEEVLFNNSHTHCITDSDVDLSLYLEANRDGGEWIGRAVSGSTFKPSRAGIGDHQIRYKLIDDKGCDTEGFLTIRVVALPEVSAGTNEKICIDGDLVELSGATPQGGHWSGVGVENGQYFNARTAGVGLHQLLYSYTNEAGCTSTDLKLFEVVDSVNLTYTGGRDEFCVNEGPYQLLANPAGGNWSGTAIAGDVFQPQVAGVGRHRLIYSFTQEGGCLQQLSIVVEVNRVPQVNSGPDLELCLFADAINLNENVIPTGGSWIGNGVRNGQFDPSFAGEGRHTLIYTFIDEKGCEGSDEKVMIVSRPPDLFLGDDILLCINSSSLDLNTLPNVPGGSWSGNGVNGNRFFPSLAQEGEHELTYEVSLSSGCTLIGTKRILVNTPPELNLGGDLEICQNQDVINLDSFTNISGGLWSGPGVEGSFLNPGLLEPGFHTLQYAIDDYLGCAVLAYKGVRVRAPIPLQVDEQIEICVNASLYDLNQHVSHTGGLWSGNPGVKDNRFDASVSGVGFFTLEYSITNSFGCQSIRQMIVNVVENQSISAGADFTLCSGSNDFDLTQYGSPEGGTWSGPNVAQNTFLISNIDAGVYELTYTIDFGNDCISEDRVQVTVEESGIESFGEDTLVCEGSESIDLIVNEALEGGNWIGSGVVNNYFDPLLVGPGTYRLIYEKTIGSCTINGERTITVNALPTSPVVTNDEIVTCAEGNFTLSARLPDNALPGSEIHWYHDGNHVGTGTGFEYAVSESTEIEAYTVNPFGCRSSQPVTVEIRLDTPSGEINVDNRRTPFGTPVRFSISDRRNAVGYVWEFGDGFISYQRSPFHTYYHDGKFTVKLTMTSEAGCTTILEAVDMVEVLPEEGTDGVVTSLEPAEVDDSLVIENISPNPSPSRFRIETNSTATRKGEVLVYSFEGETVFRQEVLIDGGRSSLTIELPRHLPAAMYIGIIKTNRQVLRFKLIKK